VAQIVDLLAWDAVLPAAGSALEQLAPLHLGMLIDAMLDPLTDFAIRRRLPRVLGTVATRRSLDGLVNGLSDSRFEVRYHCSRAIGHILSRNRKLPVDRAQVIAAVERELSVPPQRWRGYRLLDRPDVDGQSDLTARPEDSSRYLDHIVLLLSAIVGRDPLDAARAGRQVGRSRRARPRVRIPRSGAAARGRRTAQNDDRLYTVRRRCSLAIRVATHSHTIVNRTLIPANADVVSAVT
jgi:hypothetical protein